MAADKLQEEQPTLTEVIAGVQQAAQATGNGDFATQLFRTTEERRHELEAKQWKITVGSKQVILREQFERLIKAATVLKDVATVVGSSDPIHAGLPLAGFCLLMQMATNDHEEYADMVAGVEALVTIVARYRHVEDIYRQQVETGLTQDFEKQLVHLYKHIIRYQAEATCMGGLGKSEICVQLAHRLRQLFWGVFWIDVSTTSLADKSFLDLATRLQIPAQTCEEACQGLGALRQGWLLVLDNADDPHVDYQNYIPATSYGVVLMTTRNNECDRYATTTANHIPLEGLTAADARTLLLRAAHIPSGPQPRHDRQAPQHPEDGADVIVDLLQSHPLALIQAGAYVSRGHCTLADYPVLYEQQRRRLLKYHPTQAQSRYGDVYATFEASADILCSSSTEASKDALSLLPVLAALGSSPLPLDLFEFAWKGAQSALAVQDNGNEMLALQSWHALHLPSFVPVNTKAWDQFRLTEAISELRSLSLVTMDSYEAYPSVSMHPLVHAWARDRQNEVEQRASWIEAGCSVALSNMDDIWRQSPGRLLRHVESLVAWEMSKIFEPEPSSKISAILLRCGRMLRDMRADAALAALVRAWFGYMKWDLSVVELVWIDAYQLAAQNYRNCA
ncbi:hypothetical protein DV737_g2799, partial [Chaetothyriales sp. CBS 132003]